MRRIAWIRSLLLFALPFLCLADDMDDLRLRWRRTLVGGADLDPNLAQVRSRLSSIQAALRYGCDCMLQRGTGRERATRTPAADYD